MHATADRGEPAPLACYGSPPPTCWGRGCRKILCFTDAEVIDKIDYVCQNPTRAGLPEQRWSFVTPYEPTRR
jgi:hypothetical protein